MQRNLRYLFVVLLAAAAIDGAASAHSTPNKALATPAKAPVVRTDSGQVRGVEADGVISGAFSDGTSSPIAQLALASVTNPNGLNAIGNSMYAVTPNSGPATVGAPGSTGLGTLLGGNLETSNVDLSDQLTNLIVAQEAYQANTKVITTTSTVLQALMQMS